MATIIRGVKKVKGFKFGIVVSQFNRFVTLNLLQGCLDELIKCGVKSSDVTIVWVPGAWEIPVAAMHLAKKRKINAVICLGAVIRGETLHFDFVARGACDGIQRISLETGKPVVLGVLTTDTVDQAQKRAQKKGKDNKGREAAQVAIEMSNILGVLKKK